MVANQLLSHLWVGETCIGNYFKDISDVSIHCFLEFTPCRSVEEEIADLNLSACMKLSWGVFDDLASLDDKKRAQVTFAPSR